MLRAALWIREREREKESEQSARYMILTDSESLVNSLENPSWKEKDEWLLRVKDTLASTESQINIMWIPSHVGIEGNEKADELAKKGAMDRGNIVPDVPAISKAVINEKLRQAFINQSLKSFCLIYINVWKIYYHLYVRLAVWYYSTHYILW